MVQLHSQVFQQSHHDQSLTGKVAVITGGSRGIGAEIAKVLARHGAAVAINYQHSADKAEQIVADIQAENGTAVALQADVSCALEVEQFIQHVTEQLGPIDILINNAGITRDKTFKKMSLDDWQEVIDVNLTSAFKTTSVVINQMIEKQYGRIINISSIIGQAGGFGQTNYAASKAGLLGFTKSLALETAKSGVTVNSICPGFIETEMVAAMPEKVLQAIVDKVPMKRLGQTAEVAEAVLFLIHSSYITGQEINVNGGLYM